MTAWPVHSVVVQNLDTSVLALITPCRSRLLMAEVVEQVS